MAIRKNYGNAEFRFWEKPLRFHQAEALEKFRAENADEVDFWLFVQFEFYRQWEELKAYVNGLGIKIIGDIPLYMAYDSAGRMGKSRLFKLNKNLTRRKVAGVPPDYFSATGQLWGNPVYDWKVHEAEGFSWWIERIRLAFSLYDVVRIDHFRGFDRYFEIDAKAETAMGGKWKKGPGIALFDAAKAALGDLPFIAEDLGSLDAGVYRLMKKTGYPGMKVLQFAFDGNKDNPYLPQNISENLCLLHRYARQRYVGGFFEQFAGSGTQKSQRDPCPAAQRGKDPRARFHLPRGGRGDARAGAFVQIGAVRSARAGHLADGRGNAHECTFRCIGELALSPEKAHAAKVGGGTEKIAGKVRKGVRECPHSVDKTGGKSVYYSAV